jgi:Raf kinase inhibitor-like YbhB/YbcL family protein
MATNSTAGTAAAAATAGKGGAAGGTTGTAGLLSSAGSGGSTAAMPAAGSGGAKAGAGGAAGGGGAIAGAGGAAGGGSGMLGGPLMYTGTFTMGTTIPPQNKCPMSAIGGGTGENKSPALSWKGGSADTKSFALVLFDTRYSMLHWVLWDIPATLSELPAGLPSGYELSMPAGAHQAGNLVSDKHAYYGPCSSGSLAGTYEYRLYSLKTEKLSLTEGSTATQAQAAVEAAKLDMTVWSGKPM